MRGSGLKRKIGKTQERHLRKTLRLNLLRFWQWLGSWRISLWLRYKLQRAMMMPSSTSFLVILGVLLVVLPASTSEALIMEIKMDKLIEQLKRHEGVKNHAYKDQYGTWHIGAGRNIHPDGPNKGMGIS